MFPLTQQVPAHMREGGDEDEDDSGEGQGDIFRIMESGGILLLKNGSRPYDSRTTLYYALLTIALANVGFLLKVGQPTHFRR